MTKISNLNRKLIEQEMSPRIALALVDSLYNTPQSLATGSIFVLIASVATALKTGSVLIWLCTAALLLASIMRLAVARKYQACRHSLTAVKCRRWRTLHHVGAVAHMGCIGMWSFAAITITDDMMVHMVVLAVTTGVISASAGRAYGQQSIFHQQVAIAYGPLTLAMALKGSPYYLFLALLTLAFLLTVVRISANLNRIFISSLTSTEYATALADQFDTALNNMPHGLCMFRPSGQLAVMNRRFKDILVLPEGILRNDPTAENIVAECVRAGHSLSPAKGEVLLERILASESVNFVTTYSHNGKSQSLAWSMQRMVEGGTVLVLEDVTERRNAELKVEHLASYDELTQLPNRVRFRQEIKKLLAGSAVPPPSALYFIDLDHFKQVNDTLGHACGDQLLFKVANRLRDSLGPDDLVARFGGDEFMVFQRNVNSPEEAAEMAKRIVGRLSERYHINNNPIEISASVGIAMTVTDGTTYDTLLKNADLALYSAKTDTRAIYRFFHQDMAARVEARRTLELDLRRALENKELELFYQPLINLQNGRITACEALLRWNHPVHGIVSPADIVSTAEDMGIMTELGDWILGEACMECARWPDAVSVAVNISARQLEQEDILGQVRRALKLSNLEAARLETEITEDSLLYNTREIHEVLRQLRALGVRISLDDFGTGYSSLSYLHNFPLQKVKIDRSFLDSIDTTRSRTLLRGVAQLITDLGMTVVVEGIETNEQLKLITSGSTVTEGQGYLFSRPVAAGLIRDLLNASHGRRAPIVGSEQPRAARGGRKRLR
ncbi:MAG: EAL domain-containing protein [Alphaproteobacteria bacterium]|nr:EAL domain-containing protein [Alphaproteobacteria bacterium]